MSYTSRFWPKDANTLIGSIHMQLEPPVSLSDLRDQQATYTNLDQVVEKVDSLLRSRISGLEELTLQVEVISRSE